MKTLSLYVCAMILFVDAQESNYTHIFSYISKNKLSYIDFKPDTSFVTSNGFMPHWAFLTDKGEIFLCNFLHSLNQTTLFFVKQADTCKNTIFILYS